MSFAGTLTDEALVFDDAWDIAFIVVPPEGARSVEARIALTVTSELA